MSEDHVSQFVQRGLMWESGNGIHCDFTTASEALNVAVQLIKRRPRDVQRAKCRVNINGGVFTLGLGEHKPIGPKPEGVTSLHFGCLVLYALGLSGFLERHGHAEGDSFLPLAHLPFPFEPSVVGVKWSGLQVAAGTLFQRK